VAAGRFDDAQDPLARWLRARPSAAEPHYLRAQVAFARLRPLEALDELARAEALGHPRPPLDRLRGLVLARGGQWAAAEPFLRRAREKSPGPDPELDEALFQVCLATSRPEPATEALDRWIRDAPRDGVPLLAYNQIADQTGGNVWVQIKYERAALARDPALDQARLSLAKHLLSVHRLDEAAAEFAAFLARRPDDPAGHLGAGNVAQLRGDDAAAQVHFDRVLALYPRDPVAMRERAALDLRYGRPALAVLARLDQACQQDPYDPEIPRLRSIALDRLGRPGEADAERERNRRLNRELAQMAETQRKLLRTPHDLALRGQAARWMLEHGMEAEGLRWARGILGDHPGHAATTRLLADFYQRKGEVGLANFYRGSSEPGHP
jgi:tetratricopeptide (TPR) repeat protein